MNKNAEGHKVIAVWRQPFELGTPHVESWEPGITVHEIISRMQCLPAEFKEHGVVNINGITVPKHQWHLVRPKAHSIEKPVAVTFHMPMRGGGGGSRGKGVLALVAALALTIATFGIANGALAPILGASFAAGTFGAKALAFGIGLVGALVLGALSAPPSIDANVSTARAPGGQNLEPAAVQGNLLEANASIPRVLGTRRIYPPFLAEPIIELSNQDEIVNAIYGLAGAHKIEDIRLGDGGIEIPSTTVNDVSIEVREGLAGEDPLDLNIRQGRTIEYNTELTTHKVNSEDQSVLASSGNDLPVWHGVGSRKATDEIWIHFLLRGLLRNAAPTEKLRFPVRIRMRLQGSNTWRYLPELHFAGNTQGQWRMQVKFLFGEGTTSAATNAPLNMGWVEARKSVPAQNVNPIGTVWESDSYFSAGAGNDSYRQGTEGTTNVQNITLSADTVTVFLDTSGGWTPGIYEFEVIRGATFTDADYTASTYTIGGNVLDLFGFRDSLTLPLSREGLLDTVVLVRSVSIWNQYPINPKNLALISLTARNRRVDRLSVKASGYVKDWGGYDVPTAVTSTLYNPGDTITNPGDSERGRNVAFECTIPLPEDPTAFSVVWEQGGLDEGSSLYVDDNGYFVLRAGDGDDTIQVSDSNTAILKVPLALLPFDSGLHKVAWDIQVNPGRVRLWIDDIYIGEAYTSDLSSLKLSTWASTSDGAYLKDPGDTAGIVDASAAIIWDDITDASDLEVWYSEPDYCRFGNNSGNDMLWLFSTAGKIKYYPEKLYKQTVRVRRTAGTGLIYVGVEGVAADGTTLVNTGGSNDHGSQHYITAAGVGLASTFVEYDGFITGYAASGSSGSGTISTPGTLHEDAYYMQPMLLVNYSNATGITDIEYMRIEEVDADGNLVELLFEDNFDDLSKWDVYNMSGEVSFVSGEQVLHDDSSADWKILTNTSNPAPWYVEVLSGTLNFNPLPDILRDDASLKTWRLWCYLMNYTCDLVAEGIGLQEILRLIASCGYARPYQSELWGVVRDYDRSAELPVQIFTPRNSNGFSWRKAFLKLPAGLRINYRDEFDQYANRQIIVYRQGIDGNSSLLEQTTYDGIVNEDKIKQRGIFDLRQGQYRSTLYSLNAPAEWIRCRRGSLVGVEYDILDKHYSSGRIKSINVLDDEIISITLDTEVQVYNEADLTAVTDLTLEDDITLIGAVSGIAIRKNDGTIGVYTITNSTEETNTLVFDSLVPYKTITGSNYDDDVIPLIGPDNLVVVGLIGQEYRRLIVTEITPGEDLEAQLVLVDEAPQIWLPQS